MNEKESEITELKKKLRIQNLLRGKQNSKTEIGISELTEDDNVDGPIPSDDTGVTNKANDALLEERTFLISSNKSLQEVFFR